MVEPSLKENWERREEKADGNSKVSWELHTDQYVRGDVERRQLVEEVCQAKKLKLSAMWTV